MYLDIASLSYKQKSRFLSKEKAYEEIHRISIGFIDAWTYCRMFVAAW